MDELDDIVNSIQSQLQEQRIRASEIDYEDVNLDNLEAFLLKNTGKLITQSVSLVEELATALGGAADSSDVLALAELVKAGTGAAEILNKLKIAIDKNVATKEVKQMDIDSKERINNNTNTTNLLMNREELITKLLKDTEELEEVVYDV